MIKNQLTTYSERLLLEFSAYFSPYIKKLGISSSALIDPSFEIPSHKYIQLFEVAAADGRPDFGLFIGSQAHYKQFGVFGYAAKNAENLEGFLDILVKYKILISQGPDLYWSKQGGRIVISYPLKNSDGLSYRQHVEFMFAVILTTMSTYLARDLQPNFTSFIHKKPKNTKLHDSIFGKSIKFNQQENVMHFDIGLLTVGSVNADSRLLQGLIPYLEDKKISRTMNELEVRIKYIITPELYTGDITIQWLSQKMGFTVRTLQRKLKELDLTFSQILDNVREQLAIEYMNRTEYTLSEVSELLGFKENSSFTRAFKRWTNSTPKKYRNSI